MRTIPTGAIRALEGLPLALSESAVEQALRDGLPRRLPAQARKEASAVAFAVAVLSETDLGSAMDLPGREIIPDAAALGRTLGIKPKLVGGAISNLARAGVWEMVESRGERRVRFLPEMCERSSAWGALDWRTILEAVRGDLGAITLARAYARLLPPPASDWTAVSNAEVGSHAELGKDAVRRARSVLENAGILEARKSSGLSDEVRFSSFARGLGAAPAVVGSRVHETIPVSAPDPVPPLPAPRDSTPPAQRPESGLEISIGGVSITIPAGTHGWVEEMPGGGSRLHLGALVIENGPGKQVAYFAGVPLLPREA